MVTMTVEEKDGEKEKQTMENLGAKQSKTKKKIRNRDGIILQHLI